MIKPWLLLLLSLCLGMDYLPKRRVAAGVAPVTFTSDVDATPATGTSFTYTSFVVTGTKPVIVVVTGVNTTGTTGRTVTVSVSGGLTGSPVQAVVSNNAGGSYPMLSIWCVVAPAGTGTITVTLSASMAYQSNALLFANASQTAPCPTAAGDIAFTNALTGTPNPLSLTLANVTANDAVVGLGANAGDGDNPTFQQTQTFQNNGTSINMASGYRLGIGAVSVLWGVGGNMAISAARIVP